MEFLQSWSQAGQGQDSQTQPAQDETYNHAAKEDHGPNSNPASPGISHSLATSFKASSDQTPGSSLSRPSPLTGKLI